MSFLYETKSFAEHFYKTDFTNTHRKTDPHQYSKKKLYDIASKYYISKTKHDILFNKYIIKYLKNKCFASIKYILPFLYSNNNWNNWDDYSDKTCRKILGRKLDKKSLYKIIIKNNENILSKNMNQYIYHDKLKQLYKIYKTDFNKFKKKNDLLFLKLQ